VLDRHPSTPLSGPDGGVSMAPPGTSSIPGPATSVPPKAD